MGIFDWFKRKPPIASRADVVDFIDTRAAFMVQKNIFDYARALSGPFFSKLVLEQAFKDAVDKARWSSYPLALSVVTEMVHNALVSHGGANLRDLADVLSECALDVFDRYPVPAAVGEEAWKASRVTLVQRLNGISMHPPKEIKDIAVPIGQAVYDNLPFDEFLRRNDFEMVSHHLRVNLITMHEDFMKRANIPAILHELLPAAATAARD
jgi:hypothetical protein